MTKKDQPIPAWLSIPLSALSWLLVVFLTVFFSFLNMVFVLPFSVLLDKGTRAKVHAVAVIWGRSIVATSPVWNLTVEGTENVDPKKRYVIVANHQSLLDILVTVAGLTPPFKFMSKKELFWIPFIGWHMYFAGYIPLNRASKESGRQALLQARNWLRKGVGVLLFPEGTRSPDGQIKEFKMGAFRLAQEEDVEVVPVVIDGTGDAVPKKSLTLRKFTQLRLSIGKPVKVSDTDAEGLRRRSDQIRQEMIERLGKMRKDNSC